MSKMRTALALAALMVGAGRLSAQNYVVVVNASNPATSITKSELNNIFLKRVARWPDGRDAAPVNLNRTSPARNEFSRAVHGKPVSAVEAYWQSQIFAGKETPPVERPSDADVIAYVRATPGAVGYVDAGTSLGESIKVISVN
jgi:ABC-type phosphate transport system substrate-binding protein